MGSGEMTAIVTGACGGIGSAIARAFAADGANLAVCDTREAALGDVAAELRSLGADVLDCVVDVTDEEAVAAFCQSVIDRYGQVDALLNTVGVVDNMGDVESLSIDEWHRSIAINLTSAFIMAKFALPGLRQRGGTIVNISSVSGLANQANAMVYSVTKAAMLSLTRSEAIDLARFGIRAVAICPGSVSTPLIEEAARLTAEPLGRDPQSQIDEWASQYPTGRFSQPEEIADLAVFLCSERARNITGTGVVIDGGLTALLPER